MARSNASEDRDRDRSADGASQTQTQTQTDIETQPNDGASIGGPGTSRRLRSSRNSEQNLRSRIPSRLVLSEQSSLLGHPDGVMQSYSSVPRSSRPWLSRNSTGLTTPRHHERTRSWGVRLASALSTSWMRNPLGLDESREHFLVDERVWYDQYTSTDWVHDSIADNFRLRELRARKDFKSRVYAWFDGGQGWVLAAVVGIITAFIAYFVDITENAIFDIKEGYCADRFYNSKSNCCLSDEDCPMWRTWGDVLETTGVERDTIDLLFYVLFAVLFAVLSCLLTLTTKTVVQSPFSLPTLDDNLAADTQKNSVDETAKANKPPPGPPASPAKAPQQGPRIYYPAAGSGVAEVKVILSGFVMHGYLGVQTLLVKTIGLILSVASGLSLGKEGPFVHIATCVGNICCRMFQKYNLNDGKRREVLSAGAASGVAVAFGAPIAGVLFSLEEVSYYFPPKTLFRTFFCCIAAALSLKFLNPYGTFKIVIFEVRYVSDWQFFEIAAFVLLGILGGGLGALFIKASKVWARTFRRIPIIKKMPVLEVALVALVTGFMSFWNPYTKKAVTELMFELASPCKSGSRSFLCPSDQDEIRETVWVLGIAFIIKAFLTTITFGIKVPAGIYVPSMVVGGFLGRIVGHAVQYFYFAHPDSFIFRSCSADVGPEACVTPGVYALAAAGATMCGVTRLSVTLAVILFELTGSLAHVLPFSLSILVAKWTADAIEPLSIYDLLTEMNSYPFLDNKSQPTFTSELGDITSRVRGERLIDISPSPLVPATELRDKLKLLHNCGELDGGLPIIRDGLLVGLIPAPDLEFALDKLEDEEDTLCLMSTVTHHHFAEIDEVRYDPTDFTPYIDPAPIALDMHSPMNLVYQCFVKLGLRFICVLKDGRFAGLVHKKAFVHYIRELEKEERS